MLQKKKKPRKAPTSDFELLDRFVALIVDFDVDGDGLAVEIELQSEKAGNKPKLMPKLLDKNINIT